MVKKFKDYMRQKRRQWIVRKRVINFKKKILKLQKSKEKMRKKSSLVLSIS